MTNIQTDSAIIRDGAIFPVSARTLPAGLAEAGFDGDISFRPAFDEREKGNGIGSLALWFWLRGPAGGVTWELMPGCFLARTQTEWLDTFGWSTNNPTAGAVEWHSPAPMKQHDVPRYDCQLLGPGKPCYSDTGYTIGDRAYDALVTGGEAALWLFLEKMYRRQFVPKKQGETHDA